MSVFDEALIIFINDDGRQIDCYAQIIEKNAGYITFKTKTNTITIPIARLIKVKEKGEGKNGY